MLYNDFTLKYFLYKSGVFIMLNSLEIPDFINELSCNCTKVQKKHFVKNETITTYIAKRNQICILLDGNADLVRYDLNGNRFIIEHFSKYDVFGEVFYKISTNNELLVEAKRNCNVLFFTYDDIYNKCKNNCNFHKTLMENLPDLIFADGGITQIRAIKKAIDKVEKIVDKKLDIQVFGMVKSDKHKTRALINENREVIEISEDIFNLITNFQNTVHDTAIGYHKFLRDKSMTKSELDNISGIGTVKKLALLKKFGSVENIKNANVSEITEVKGINEELANKIKQELNNC